MLENWMNNNKLVINSALTRPTLWFWDPEVRAPLRRQVSMMAGTFCIKPSETETLLGGHIHQTLQWNQHISDHKSSLIRQLTGRINGLKQISRTFTFSTRLMIANGAIMSKLGYLITVWRGASQYLMKALQVNQLTAARTVCGFNSWG